MAASKPRLDAKEAGVWAKCGHIRTPATTAHVSTRQPGGECRVCLHAYQAKYLKTVKGQAVQTRKVNSLAMAVARRKHNVMRDRAEESATYRARIRAAEVLTADRFHPLDAKRVAVLSDIQFPFVDWKALAATLDYLDDFKPDTVILNGDILDFYSISTFEKDPAKGWASLKVEQEMGHELQDELLACGYQVMWLGGNHEDRWRRLVWSRRGHALGPDLTTQDLVAETYKVPTNADDLFRGIFVRPQVAYYPYRHFVTLADDRLWVMHGIRISQHSGWSAKAHLDKWNKSIIVGHSHRLGEYSRTVAHNEQKSGWDNGCLCSLDPEYDTGPNWQQGFSTVVIDAENNYTVRQHKIMNGRILGETTR